MQTCKLDYRNMQLLQHSLVFLVFIREGMTLTTVAPIEQHLRQGYFLNVVIMVYIPSVNTLKKWCYIALNVVIWLVIMWGTTFGAI